MLRFALLLSFASLCFCAITPLYQGNNFKAFKVEDDYPNFATRREVQENTKRGLRSIVEIPINGSVPVDDGSALFGDIEFSGTRKNGSLIIRDTIVNQNYYNNILIYYSRNVTGYYVEDLRIYNVGRQRGVGSYATIYHNDGYVEAGIIIAANNTVRIFAEIYVR